MPSDIFSNMSVERYSTNLNMTKHRLIVDLRHDW
jgi:hypothetical protein